MGAELEFISDHRVLAVVEHWRDLLQGNQLPLRRELDPACFRLSLPFVWIVEILGSGRARLRLAGEEINRLFGRSLRDKFLDEILTAPELAELSEKIEAALAGPSLSWGLGPLFEVDPYGPSGECVVMPLRPEGEVQPLLGCTVYEYGAWAKDPPRLLALRTIHHLVPVAEL